MPTTAEFQSLAVKAAVTFLQVFIGILLGAQLFGGDLETVSAAQSAAAGGLGAALSVFYNWLTNLGTRLEPAVELAEGEA